MCIKKKKIKIFSGILATQMCVLSFFSGCASTDQGNDKIVIVDQEEPAATYILATAVKDDVVQSKNMRCVYVQLNGQEVSFELSGRTISKVYVQEGDSVTKGQVLAELSSGNRDADIENLEYQITRNKLLLKQVEDNENYEISRRWLNYLYNSGKSAGEEQSLKDGITTLQRNNQYTKEDYQDAIALDEQQLQGLQEEAKQSRVVAALDGTVMDLKERLEGSTSTRDEVIMTVMDNTQCVFSLDNLSNYSTYFTDGTEVDMTISYGSGAGDYKLIPYEMEKWDDTLLFAISEGVDGKIIEPGTSGTMKVLTAIKEQVLSLPKEAIHKADDQKYVYVVGENNMREVKWVETGLEGDSKVEILSGIVEGEKVIIK